jgi:glycosyltransferase involved in cell wall biosynthesis/GT2 family glycosyltransferase
MASGERGGAEALYDGLVHALRSAGHDAAEVPVHVDESTFESVIDSYARCYALDLRQYDLVISTKAPTFMVSHPNHVSYLVHTVRVFYDMFEAEYGRGSAAQHAQRRIVHALDRFGLRPGRVRRHFSIGATPFRRLLDASSWWQAVRFQPLHPAPMLSGFKRPKGQDYILMPGRLHRWKRVGLMIEAYKHLRRNVPLLVTGTGEDEQALRALAAGDPRIRFLGRVSEPALLDLYANALLVGFIPRQEDFGYITIEAFKSGKAVLTCTDSGEPLQFVRDGQSGFVVPPNAKAIAERLTQAIDHPRHVAQMGRRGAKAVEPITWDAITAALVGTCRARRATRPTQRVQHHSAGDQNATVTVVDMQPIEPAVGGGRLRLLGLYHNLGLPTTYVGTYDWPGEAYRRHRLSETLEEIDIPLSDAHFAAAAEWKERAGGKTIIDSAFSHLAHHSAAYVEAARRAVADADIVVFSHPWVFPLVKDLLRRRPQLVVYDSHNVEAVLRYTLLADSPFGVEIAQHAAVIERDLCGAADLVLACSHDDRRLFHDLYDVPFGKCLVVPNGTFTDRVAPPSTERRGEAKRVLGLRPGPVAIFIGSLYPPNVEAARFINTELAPQLTEVTFVLCGGVGEALAKADIAPNVRVTMTIPEEQKRQFLDAADIAMNPMFSGSGTNIKMFEFMAAGLPIVTTAVGARGCDGLDPAFVIASAHAFASTVRTVLADRDRACSMGAAGRRLVSERYSWERISASLGRLLRRHRTQLGKPRPAVSVIVPTYARHDVLDALMECLAAQTAKNFEVIVVDQSETPWQCDASLPFDLEYVHTDVKGAGNARNTGAFYARGDILAFTDDDCRPDADWLENGLRYFANHGVIGVEGLVVSDRAHDDHYRAVTNVGFEGIGFMTANLFLRRDTFHAVGGFDALFDPLPFREDTDLGWRALEHGSIPYGADVRVYHPPQPRASEREALGARARFFENDALLLKKHPDRYRTLFLRERHFAHTPGFFDHLQRGATKYGVQIDDFYLSHRQTARNERKL